MSVCAVNNNNLASSLRIMTLPQLWRRRTPTQLKPNLREYLDVSVESS